MPTASPRSTVHRTRWSPDMARFWIFVRFDTVLCDFCTFLTVPLANCVNFLLLGADSKEHLNRPGQAAKINYVIEVHTYKIG